METIDFAVGWPEPLNAKDLFMNSLNYECKSRKLKFLVIDTKNIKSIEKKIRAKELKIKFYFDMASETYDLEHPFTRLVYLLKDEGARIVDDPDSVKSAADKSITHFDLVKSNILVPYTVVIRTWEPEKKLTKDEEARLGIPFVVKPALGYGQQGVAIIKKKRPLKELAEARKFSRGDNFLLQEFIEPLIVNGRPSWFRVYQLFGEIIPCWWNPENHEYAQVTMKEMDELKLMPIVRIASEIGRITRIDWFSCEIAISAKDKKFVTIDYMNDQCAIYPKSEHKDGVPDDLIIHFAQRLVDKAARYINGERTLTYRALWFPKVMVKDESV